MLERLFITRIHGLICLLAGFLVVLASEAAQDQRTGWGLLMLGLLLMVVGGVVAMVGVPLPRQRPWVSLLLLLVVLLALGYVSAWVLYLSPTHSSSPFFDRHGVPDDIPLPDGIAFVSYYSHTYLENAAGAKQWIWTSKDPPLVVQQFYLAHLDALSRWGVEPHAVQLDPEDLLVTTNGSFASSGLAVEAQGKSVATSAPLGGSVLTISFWYGP